VSGNTFDYEFDDDGVQYSIHIDFEWNSTWEEGRYGSIKAFSYGTAVDISQPASKKRFRVKLEDILESHKSERWFNKRYGDNGSTVIEYLNPSDAAIQEIESIVKRAVKLRLFI